MDILFPRCAGIDVHKRTVVACRIVLTDDGEWLRETRTYGTTSEELLLSWPISTSVRARPLGTTRSQCPRWLVRGTLRSTANVGYRVDEE